MTNRDRELFFSKYLNFFITTGIISLILTLLNLKGHGFILLGWLKSWGVAFLVIFVLSFFLPKLISTLVNKYYRKKEES
ncbi:DUF2798 domain-containing protein [Enterococcus faecalis]|uniref:DUF2798 domain-containing protein n=1 Tax=Enterococcus faecalis TaxID=1351 RepID=UPI004042F4B7